MQTITNRDYPTEKDTAISMKTHAFKRDNPISANRHVLEHIITIVTLSLCLCISKHTLFAGKYSLRNYNNSLQIKQIRNSDGESK